MRIDLFCLGLVEGNESVQDVVACRVVVCTSLVVWEVVLHRRDGQLLLKSVDLVQEQDDTRLDEPSRIADAIEKCKGFLHSVDSLVFEEQLVVLRNGDEEKDGGDVFETVNPLLSF